jgi:hypothetical protein
MEFSVTSLVERLFGIKRAEYGEYDASQSLPDFLNPVRIVDLFARTGLNLSEIKPCSCSPKLSLNRIKWLST